MTILNNYNDVFNNVFLTADVFNDELPVGFLDDVAHEVQESNYWQDKAHAEFMDEYGYNPYEIENDDEDELTDWYEFENEYFIDVAYNFYVAYTVTIDETKQLPDELPIYWSDDLESYVFLQAWYGMSAKQLTLDNPVEY